MDLTEIKSPQIRVFLAIERIPMRDIFTTARIARENKASWNTVNNIFIDLKKMKLIREVTRIGRAKVYERV
jgi:CRISPR/Cas system CSM-associated protein Csm2 small subunit